jgi:hypothetical protein
MSIQRFESTTSPFYWYTQSQLILYDNRLYDMSRMYFNTSTLEYVQKKKPQPVATMLFRDRVGLYPKKYWLYAEYTNDPGIFQETYNMPWTVFTPDRAYVWDASLQRAQLYDHFTAPARKIQRNMRKQARARLQAKHLALLMSTHARLGQSSLIQKLGLDLMRLCLDSEKFSSNGGGTPVLSKCQPACQPSSLT